MAEEDPIEIGRKLEEVEVGAGLNLEESDEFELDIEPEPEPTLPHPSKRLTPLPIWQRVAAAAAVVLVAVVAVVAVVLVDTAIREAYNRLPAVAPRTVTRDEGGVVTTRFLVLEWKPAPTAPAEEK